jgi:hypothetical protein
MAQDDFKHFLKGYVASGEHEGGEEPIDLPAAPVPPLATPDLPAKLGRVVERSIEQADHILDLPLDRDHPQYAAELRAKTAVINTTLATQVKVDDLRLKHQGDPKVLERLLAEIREAKANNPMLCEGPNQVRAAIGRPPVRPVR